MSNETMRAITILGPRQIRYGETETPAYGEDEVLVRVHCVGICATDLEIYDGSMLYFQDGRATYPIIPGHEWSGEIVAVGSQVRGFAIGDRVVGETTLACGRCPICLNGRYNLCPNRKENGILGKHGATAEYMSFPAFALHKISDNIPYDQACLIEPAAVAFRGASRIRIGPEDTVAVFGAGPIGLLSVQMAKAFGAKRVALIDYNRPRLELGQRMGADDVIDLNDVSLTEAAKAYTNGEGYTTIIEASGNPQAMADTIRLAAEGARICMIGLCGGRHAHMDIDKVVTSDLEMIGSVSSPGVWQHVVPLFAAGKVNVLPLMTHRFPLERYEEALQLIERRDPSVLKILIQIV